MHAFIKSINERACHSILTRRTPPKAIGVFGNEVIKPEIEWTTNEDQDACFNSKALNAIFYVVAKNQFKLISTCETAKEAWEIL